MKPPPTLADCLTHRECEVPDQRGLREPHFGSGWYSAWATLNNAGSNCGDDHDNDGVDNGTEYFLGGPNGNTTGFTPLPAPIDNAGTLSITWSKGNS